MIKFKPSVTLFGEVGFAIKKDFVGHSIFKEAITQVNLLKKQENISHHVRGRR